MSCKGFSGCVHWANFNRNISIHELQNDVLVQISEFDFEGSAACMSLSDELFQMFVSKVVEAMRNLVLLTKNDTFEYMDLDVLNLWGSKVSEGS